MLLQILRFVVPSSMAISCPAFSSLRRDVATAGAIAQYFGYSVQTRVAPLPKPRHEISWIIRTPATLPLKTHVTDTAFTEWPDDLDLSQKAQLTDRLNELSTDSAVSLLVDLADKDSKDLLTGLQAPVCEVVTMKMKQDAPFKDAAFRNSMHKTYTDCYRMQGFVGGDWGYAVNTNHTGGENVTSERLDGRQRRLAIYLLGWESIELHEDAGKTEVFAEEMDKLGPWIDAGSGAWYTTLTKHE
ncbi:hypothetical protein NM208_g12376 [Fusarium decemcellulare]|uniref:Uncharacterized protein n=1 Tax=Fusarium decemcellulare TaxID=57161 RepID=A0ACC1RSF4_9HYPO|nr:hypothetical protein NM208_g12376 [Fusarium decemcellulare]